MDIYLDNSATTRPYHDVCEIVMRTMDQDYGNPSSMHQKGVDAERYVRDAAKIIAESMRVQDKEIFFTSGGTESNNWALIGSALANKRKGNRIITTAVEHPAVSQPMHFLQEQGFDLVTIGVDVMGHIDMAALSDALDEQTILVSTMYVNNEIGAVEPIGEIAQLIHDHATQAVYHVDAIQGYGKYRIYPKQLGIDLLSVSGHKIHGPKGVGFLYIGENTRILPLMYGGGQQSGMRSGTDNVPGIAGLGVAVRQTYQDLEKKQSHLYDLKCNLIEGLRMIDRVVIHGVGSTDTIRETAPQIVNASFVGVGSEVLLHALEDRGIYVSAGSACSTHKRSKSPTLVAIGASADELASSVRFSFAEENTIEEIDETLSVLMELIPMLRRYRAH